MKYTVGWRPTAERKLNDILNETPDKSAVSQAAAWLAKHRFLRLTANDLSRRQSSSCGAAEA